MATNQGRQEGKATIMRGADGEIYFIRDEVLQSCRVPDDLAKEIEQTLGGQEVQGFSLDTSQPLDPIGVVQGNVGALVRGQRAPPARRCAPAGLPGAADRVRRAVTGLLRLGDPFLIRRQYCAPGLPRAATIQDRRAPVVVPPVCALVVRRERHVQLRAPRGPVGNVCVPAAPIRAAMRVIWRCMPRRKVA